MKNFLTITHKHILDDCRKVRNGALWSANIGKCTVGKKERECGTVITYEAKRYYLKAYVTSTREWAAVRSFTSAMQLADYVRENRREEV